MEEIALSEDGKIVKVLSNPSFKLIGLGFKEGQSLDKHSTSSKAILIVQSGNVEHEVKANIDSYLYLIK